MRNREYQNTIRQRGVDHWLEVEVFSTIYPEPQRLYSVPLTILEPQELLLDQGRFALFIETMPEHVVTFPMNWIQTSVDFDQKLQWIEQNVKDDWSFNVSMQHVSEGTISWAFVNRQEAVLFKLTF